MSVEVVYSLMLLDFEAFGQFLKAVAGEAIGPALGAGFGASAALFVDRARESRKRDRERKAALRYARVVVRAYAADLRWLWEEYLGPLRDKDDERWRRLAPLLTGKPTLELDIRSLAFLTELGQDDLLDLLVRLESDRKLIARIQDERGQLYSSFREKVAKAINQFGEDIAHYDDEELFGADTVRPLRSLTDRLYVHAEVAKDRSIAALRLMGGSSEYLGELKAGDGDD